MERYGDAGQPLWPVVPSSLYGAFLAGEAKEARILIITFDASVDGWGAVVRSSPEERGTEFVGGYRLAVPIHGRAFVDPAALPACPTSQVYRETLAGFLATRVANQLHALTDRTVLIRSDCTGGDLRSSQGLVPVAGVAERGATSQPPLRGLGSLASALPASTRHGHEG